MMNSKFCKNVTRREFVETVGKASLILVLPLSGCGIQEEEIEPGCLEALTPEEKTLAALADTVVPGSLSDPTGAPGAIEACALNLIYDDSMPVAEAAPLLVSLLDGISRTHHDQKFVALSLEERTQIVQEAEQSLPLLTWLLKLIRCAFYVGTFSDVGLKYLGYPGPNLGYINQGFTFGEKMSEELTPNGNLP
jgi:hypothetical protein